MINEMLKKLSLEEKIGQLVQVDPSVYNLEDNRALFGVAEDAYYVKEDRYLYGSVLGVHDKTQALKIQRQYLENSKHKIPLLFMSDIIHGCHTVYPIPLAQAASFNRELVKDAASIAAKEAASTGIHVTFSPMTDVSKDIRWGRVMEGYGEDPYLAGEMGYQAVMGYQGDFSFNNVAACLKHFAGYGAPEAGRDYNTVNISKIAFLNEHLRAYEKTLMAKPELVMTSFNTLFGIPATANKYLLKDILRDSLDFKGVVISDFAATSNMVNHKYAENSFIAANKAINAGLDIDMISDVYSKNLKNVAEDDPKTIKLIDEAVKRVLSLKEKLGLFNDPFRGLIESDEDVKFYDDGTNLKLALESAVLLKNEGVLPLKDTKVYLTGEFADSRKTNGNWSWVGGSISNNKTLKEVFPNQTSYEDAEVVIYCFGERERSSGESQSKTNPKVNAIDVAEIKKIKAYGKKVVGVVYAGRPLILTEVEPYLNALVYGFYLGNQMNEALKLLLIGEENFSGRMPASIPLNIGQIPISYQQFSTSRPQKTKDLEEEYVSNYKDSPNEPLYFFGDGLSYSKIKYKSLSLDKRYLKENESFNLTIELENLSQIAVKEVVQVYINDLFSEIVRPNMELIAFEKIMLKPFETKKIKIKINYADLTYKDENNINQLEKGPIEVMIGTPRKIILKETIFIV